MKKVMSLYLCVILLLFCGCAKQNSAEDLPLNPAGTYIDVSFTDTNSLYVDFLLHSAGEENEKKTFVVTGTKAPYSYQDSVFSGRLTDNGDGDFTATKEQVITNDPLVQKTAELQLEQIPHDSYKLYDNYIIKKVPLSTTSITGDLPSESKNTTCFINFKHITFSIYTLSFSSDGSCEMTTMFNNDICSASGTYSVNGKIVSLNFTEGVFYGETLSGNTEMALYVENNTLYSEVYRRQ